MHVFIYFTYSFFILQTYTINCLHICFTHICTLYHNNNDIINTNINFTNHLVYSVKKI